MGIFTLFSERYQRYIDASQDPEYLVAQGDIDTLKRCLDNDLILNFDSVGGSLLYRAITGEHIQITALLIFRGADPNKSHIRDYHQHTETECILGWQYYCESLVKFMMTYNAHFDHEKQFSDRNECIAAAIAYAPRRYELYDFIQEGEYAFETKNYVKAKTAFEKSILLFDGFIQEEEEKWARQLAGVDVAVGHAKHAKETHPDIIHYYKVRRDNCVTKIAECHFQLNQPAAAAGSSDDTEETSSLLSILAKKNK